MKDKTNSSKNRGKEVVAAVEVEVIPVDRNEKVQFFLHKVEDKVISMIDTKIIKMSEEEKPFLLHLDKDQQIAQKRIKQLFISKREAQSQLAQIILAEKDAKANQRLIALSKDCHQNTSLKSHHKTITEQYTTRARPKSELSLNDITLLKKLKKQQHQFENQVKNKTKKYIELMDKLHSEEKQLQNKRINQKNEQKRNQIQSNLDELARKREERNKQFQEEQKKIIEIKTRRKIFSDMESMQRKKEEREVNERNKELERISEERQMNYSELQQHREKYETIRRNESEKREQQKCNFVEMERMRLKESSSVDKSKYYTLVVGEKRKKLAEEQSKQREKIDLIEAQKEYSQLIQRDHIPRVKTPNQQEPPEKVVALDFEETKILGNRYLQEVKKMLDQQKSKKPSKLHKSIQQADINYTNAAKYKDYLSQLKTHRTMFQDSKVSDSTITDRTIEIKDVLIRQNLDLIQRVMKSKDSKINKLEKVKRIAEQLQASNQVNLIDKIAAKIKILESIKQE